jgi:hypothetical protein
VTGRIVVMGSGEVAPALVATHRSGIAAAGADRVTVLDTPFGFQENVDQLTAKLVDFFRASLQVEVEVASLRSPASSTLETEQFLAAIRRSRYVFAGPGSPSYALRVWRDRGVADALAEVIGGGGTVAFASAAALTLGMKTIPVYEIYKAGEQLHWLEGLGVTARFGLPVTVVPHWNNAEGGNHDTSRCYIGERRLRLLSAELEAGILGVDEHSAATIDLGAGCMRASGVGGVVLRGAAGGRIEPGGEMRLETAQALLAVPPSDAAVAATPPAGAVIDLATALATGDADGAVEAVLTAEAQAAGDEEARGPLRSMIVELGEAARLGIADPRVRIGPFVEALLELREAARADRRFEEADLIRDRLLAAGVEVRDTQGGVEWGLRP